MGCGRANLIDHAEKLSDLPDEHMADILPTLKKLAIATVRPPRIVGMRCS